VQTPHSLLSLVDEGLIEQVLRPLMSGKEAQVFLVRSGGELRVAKVYKDAQHRSFKQRAEYTEGRNVRNSRDQRAIGKRTRHGREKDEAAWRTAEVDMIYRLRTAGVRVPEPHHFVDGVLIMELVTDADGQPAPRLGDLNLDPDQATRVFHRVLAEVIRMLAAGVVHGDLSDFNVLMGVDGPVIIDFPQAVDASSNQNARKLLLRDVDNLHRFLAKVIPGRRPPPFAQELWQLYERGELTPDTKLSGSYRAVDKLVNTDDVFGLITDAERDERRRRESLGMRMPQQDRPPQQDRRPPQQDRRPPQQDRRPPQQDRRPPQQDRRPPQQDRRPPHNQPRVEHKYPRQAVAATPPPLVQATDGSAPATKRKRRRRRRKSNAGGAVREP
jgi:RIO kinase 1